MTGIVILKTVIAVGAGVSVYLTVRVLRVVLSDARSTSLLSRSLGVDSGKVADHEDGDGERRRPPLLLRVASGIGHNSRRAHSVERHLPDALITVCNHLKTGSSLPEALLAAGRDTPGKLGVALEDAGRRYRTGVPLVRAIEEASAQVVSDGLAYLAQSSALFMELGGDITPYILALAGNIRAKQLLEDELRAKTAEGRLTASILSLLPPVLAVLVFSFQPELLDPLVGSTSGQWGLLGGIALWAAGILLVRRLLQTQLAVGG